MKTVVLASGGIESITTIRLLLDEGNEVFPLHIFYGQKNGFREFPALTEILVDWLDFKNLHTLHLVNLERLSTVLQSALTTISIEIPESRATLLGLDNTNVPFRNGILISIGVGYAKSINAEVVAIGINQHGTEIADVHEDGTAIFIHAMSNAIRVGTNNQIGLSAPLQYKTKAQTIELAYELGIPLEKCRSCYRSEKLHCGNCRACYERRKGFKDANIKDPTEYER